MLFLHVFTRYFPGLSYYDMRVVIVCDRVCTNFKKHAVTSKVKTCTCAIYDNWGTQRPKHSKNRKITDILLPESLGRSPIFFKQACAHWIAACTFGFQGSTDWTITPHRQQGQMHWTRQNMAPKKIESVQQDSEESSSRFAWEISKPQSTHCFVQLHKTKSCCAMGAVLSWFRNFL
jgi:hypothetical protein